MIAPNLNLFKVVTSDEFACSGDFHTATDLKIDENSPGCAEVSGLNTDSKYIRYQRIKYMVREMDYLSTLLLFNGAARTSRNSARNSENLFWNKEQEQEQKQIQFWPGIYNFFTSKYRTPARGPPLHALHLHMSINSPRHLGQPLSSNYYPFSTILKTPVNYS